MKVLQVLVLIFGLSVSANAQKTLLSGTVYDQEGAVISETKITLTNKDGKKFEALANDDGIYKIIAPAGTYLIEVIYPHHQAWGKFSIEKYELPPVPKMNLDVTLRVSEEYTKKYGTPVTGEPIKNNKSKRKTKNSKQ